MAFESRMNVVVMYAKPYALTDEDTGEIRSGLTVEYYFFGDHGESIKPVYDASAETFGIRRSKCSIPKEQLGNISYVPGVYNAGFLMDVNADGKPILKLQNLEYVGKALVTLDKSDEEPVADGTASDEKAKDQPNASDKTASKSVK